MSKTSMAFNLGQLRHQYKLLAAGCSVDRGLVYPVLAALEAAKDDRFSDPMRDLMVISANPRDTEMYRVCAMRFLSRAIRAIEHATSGAERHAS